MIMWIFLLGRSKETEGMNHLCFIKHYIYIDIATVFSLWLYADAYITFDFLLNICYYYKIIY